MNMDVFASECLDFIILQQCPIEQLDSNLRGFQNRKRLHYRYIHKTVRHGSVRSNICIIPILGCIGTSNQERLILGRFSFYLNLVRIRLIFQTFPKRVLQISQYSAFLRMSEFGTYKSIKPHTACTKKRDIIYLPIIQTLDIKTIKYLNGTKRIHGNA